MKVRDMFFWLVVIAVFTSLLLLASGSIERISMHAIDAKLESESKPNSVMDVVSANRSDEQELSMWPVATIFIITTTLFAVLIIGVLNFGAPFIKNANNLAKTMKRPLTRQSAPQRSQSPYIIEPVQPIQLGTSGGGDYQVSPQLPQEVDTSWLEN